MLETMYVRCTHCGYDNSPEYRFCGMCGASLPHPPAAPKPPEKTVAGNGGNGSSENVHGPSFLGLAEDPKVEFHYLYEDEQPRSHVGLIAFLLIILGAAGALGWQWHQGGFPFNRLNASGAADQSASPSEITPAQSQDQQTHIDKPMTGAGDVLPTAPDQKAQPDSTGKTTEVPVENGKAGTTTNTASPSASGTENAPEAEKAQENKAPEKTEEAKATPPAEVPAKPRTPKTPARMPKPPPSQPASATSAAAAASPDADLELAGERYLYGNGLPQNCARAESNLRNAATHGNTKAQTVLGTMYATGHCVGRDLPTAYRWFARALHQEPQNSRISADLQVLWRQMTPQEKQLATTSGQ
jgi:zinc ribbon protein/Sel1 repeat-containing protein